MSQRTVYCVVVSLKDIQYMNGYIVKHVSIPNASLSPVCSDGIRKMRARLDILGLGYIYRVYDMHSCASGCQGVAVKCWR